MRSTIVFLGQDYDRNSRWLSQAAEWSGINRIERARYTVRHDESITVELLAEDAFAVFNAPDECLTENQLLRKRLYRGPSLSVGDIVQIHRDGVLHAECLCMPCGWDIQLRFVEIC